MISGLPQAYGNFRCPPGPVPGSREWSRRIRSFTRHEIEENWTKHGPCAGEGSINMGEGACEHLILTLRA